MVYLKNGHQNDVCMCAKNVHKQATFQASMAVPYWFPDNNHFPIKDITVIH